MAGADREIHDSKISLKPSMEMEKALEDFIPPKPFLSRVKFNCVSAGAFHQRWWTRILETAVYGSPVGWLLQGFEMGN